MEKHRRLEQILRSQEPGSKIIIFCSTKKMCDQLSRNLTRQFGAAAIHGDKSQSERDYVLNQFRSGRTPILVATDVAARGLDIKDIRFRTAQLIVSYICTCVRIVDLWMVVWPNNYSDNLVLLPRIPYLLKIRIKLVVKIAVFFLLQGGYQL